MNVKKHMSMYNHKFENDFLNNKKRNKDGSLDKRYKENRK